MSSDDHDSELPSGADLLTSTLGAGQPEFRVDDQVEYERERDAIQAALFGTAPPQLKIGRFTVLDRIGQGGMGTVYTAYDDQLDRKVAVKILRQRGTAKDSAQVARLLREAQAMARLSHPNTVTVHEVGEHEDGVFIAMEFVRGESLDRWLDLDGEPRPWREVVEVFRQAGLGLVAAHEAGIVHRDFKPHNVIRGDDGLVQVLDFGLARSLGQGEHDDELDGDDELSSASSGSAVALSHKLTVTGAILGTPAYMAPEQWQGRDVDERSDQFSFCVALYEGLHGQLPFAGDTPAALLDNVLDGRVRELSGSRVPAWIDRAVARGLATKPAERHPSMGALVELLGRDPALTRRRWIRGVALAVLVVGGSVGLTVALREPPTQPCSGVEEALASTFNPARIERAEAAVLATKLGYAQDTWARVAPQLHGYAEEWIERSGSACRAHHDGRMSSTLFDRATACLATRRNGLDALLEVLEGADASVVEGAIDATAKLPSLAACVDEARLSAALPEPLDPTVAATVERSRARIARARVLHHTGRLDEAQTELDAALETAEALEQQVLLAEVELARGTVWQEAWMADEADEALSHALELGLALGHVEVASEAAARRMHVRATMQYRFDEALVDVGYGAALLQRSGDEGPLSWLYFNNAGTLHDTRGSDDEARELYARALAVLDGEGDSLEAVFTRSNLAQLEVEHHRFDVGLASQREALAVAQRLYGPQHPMSATLLYILANMLSESGALAESVKVVARSLALEEAARGPGSPALRPQLALSAKLANLRRRHAEAEAFARRALASEAAPDFFSVGLRHALGDAQLGRGERADGLVSHGEALELAREIFADQESQLAWSHQGLAIALLEAGLPEDLGSARTHARRAVELRDANPDTSETEVTSALLCLARVELALGDTAAVGATLERAQAGLAGAVPDDSPLFSLLWQLRGHLAVERGSWDEALTAYHDAVVTLEAHRDPDDPMLATTRFVLARVLAETGSSGHGEAGAAREVFAALGPAYGPEVDEIDRWLGVPEEN